MFVGYRNGRTILRKYIGHSIYGLHRLYEKTIEIAHELDDYLFREVLEHEESHTYEHDEYKNSILTRCRLISKGLTPLLH